MSYLISNFISIYYFYYIIQVIAEENLSSVNFTIKIKELAERKTRKSDYDYENDNGEIEEEKEVEKKNIS